MIESDYSKMVQANMRSRGWNVQAHEDRYSNFIPDLSAARSVHVWIELKWCERAPLKLNNIRHWTRGQEEWLIKRQAAGGSLCFLLLGTPRRHYLWNADVFTCIRHIPFADATVKTSAMADQLDTVICALGRHGRDRQRHRL